MAITKYVPKISVSLLLSITVHALFFVVLVFTISEHKAAPLIMVNLQKNAKPEQNVIKAGLVNKKNIDLAIQRHAAEEKAKQQKIIDQQQKIEREKQEKIASEQAQAKKALELAAAQKAKIEIEAKKAAQEKAAKYKAIQEKSTQEKMAKEKILQEKLAQEKLRVEKQTALNDQAKKSQAQAKAQKDAAALRAERDRFQAEHNALLETEVDKYSAEFREAIEDNRIISNIFAKGIRCAIRIRLLPDGSILSVNVTEPSGNKAYDDLQISAIYKTAPFTMPEDPEIYESLRDLVLSFRNGEQLADAQ